jgi:hypothetical protein
MTAPDLAALRALAEKATPGMASAMTSKQIADATAAIVALRDAMHPAAVLALLDEVDRLRAALRKIAAIHPERIGFHGDIAQAALEPNP